MRELIEAGADVFRLNFSHGTADEHREIGAMADPRSGPPQAAREIGILGDLPGPKLRLGEIGTAASSCTAAPRSRSRWTARRRSGTPAGVVERAAGAVSEGGDVYLADGRIRLRVLDRSEGTDVRCKVEAGGRSPPTRA